MSMDVKNKSAASSRRAIASESWRARRWAAAVLGAGALLAAPFAVDYNHLGLVRAETILPQTSSQLPGSFAPMVERVMPAVVNVSTTQKLSFMGGGRQFSMPEFPEGSPFGEFFRRFFEEGPLGQGGQGGTGPMERESHSLGSGFIVDPDGYVVTNNHVIKDATDIEVTLNDDRTFPATVVGTDPDTDIALLKIDADEALPAVPWGDSKEVKVGDWVVAVGNPFGLGGTVTLGILSARGRNIRSGPFDDFLQIDAAINRGNSGGPTFDTTGRVIGINTAIYSPNGGSVGIGFAVPSEMARSVVDQLMDSGSVSRGWLGVSIQDVTPELAEGLGLDSHEGALVASVVPDSPAAKAGFQTGDVITRFAGRKVADARELTRAVATFGADKETSVSVVRDGDDMTLSLVTGTRPGADRLASLGGVPTPDTAEADTLGVAVQPLTDDLRQQFSLDAEVQGLLVTDVKAGSPAAAEGLRRGDVIRKVGRETVTSAADLTEAVQDARANGRDTVVVLIYRDGNERFVPLDVSAG